MTSKQQIKLAHPNKAATRPQRKHANPTKTPKKQSQRDSKGLALWREHEGRALVKPRSSSARDQQDAAAGGGFVVGELFVVWGEVFVADVFGCWE